jgi:hypothetical protein
MILVITEIITKEQFTLRSLNSWLKRMNSILCLKRCSRKTDVYVTTTQI